MQYLIIKWVFSGKLVFLLCFQTSVTSSRVSLSKSFQSIEKSFEPTKKTYIYINSHDSCEILKNVNKLFFVKELKPCRKESRKRRNWKRRSRNHVFLRTHWKFIQLCSSRFMSCFLFLEEEEKTLNPLKQWKMCKDCDEWGALTLCSITLNYMLKWTWFSLDFLNEKSWCRFQ